jgi:hypothetical protein
MDINIDGCRRLWLAVIAQGVDDVRRHLAGKPLIDDHSGREGPAAMRWLKNQDFERCCENTGLAPAAVRRAVLKDQTP